MHMEAITFLFSSSTDSSSAGHDYNRAGRTENTASLPSLEAARFRDVAVARDPGEKQNNLIRNIFFSAAFTRNVWNVANAALSIPGH